MNINETQKKNRLGTLNGRAVLLYSRETFYSDTAPYYKIKCKRVHAGHLNSDDYSPLIDSLDMSNRVYL